MTWLSELGEKSSRTDIWVGLYTLTFLLCLYLHVACGTGIIELCNDNFLSYNQYILSTLILGIMVDLGIKQWKK